MFSNALIISAIASVAGAIIMGIIVNRADAFFMRIFSRIVVICKKNRIALIVAVVMILAIVVGIFWAINQDSVIEKNKFKLGVDTDKPHRIESLKQYTGIGSFKMAGIKYSYGTVTNWSNRNANIRSINFDKNEKYFDKFRKDFAEYSDGATMGYERFIGKFYEGYEYYNLGGEYDILNFKYGSLDTTTFGKIYIVFYDNDKDKYIDHFSIEAAATPKDGEIKITGIEVLKIQFLLPEEDWFDTWLEPAPAFALANPVLLINDPVKIEFYSQNEGGSITANADGKKIRSGAVVKWNKTVQITINPKPGYIIKTLLVNGESKKFSNNVYAFKATEDTVITVEFAENNKNTKK